MAEKNVSSSNPTHNSEFMTASIDPSTFSPPLNYATLEQLHLMILIISHSLPISLFLSLPLHSPLLTYPSLLLFPLFLCPFHSSSFLSLYFYSFILSLFFLFSFSFSALSPSHTFSSYPSPLTLYLSYLSPSPFICQSMFLSS